ncbi:alpha-hydroxy-acid oxidizing protein [Aliarcobacter butzleri]|uniref:alpha-hydroxy-acid oxidizing protein n=1 Tax=Aliarcobacter butzleri TaxID=28197 RepID=UPI003AFA1534
MEDLSHKYKYTIIWKNYETPIFIAPVAYQKLVDIDGEIATAQAANAMNSCMIVSSFSSSTFDDIKNIQILLCGFSIYST